MRNKAMDAAQMERKRRDFLETGFKLFAEKNIETVTLPQIAKASGYGQTTMYRYFDKKPGFVVEVATRKWEQFREENRKRIPGLDFERMTAAEIFAFYLDSFLVLYREHRDLLRFNQVFNVYVNSEKIDAGTLQPYQGMIDELKDRFHEMYLKAGQDGTVRTDEPEDKMFSKTLHLMLAAATRYAVGLVYSPVKGFDPEEELLSLKNMFLREYVRTEKSQ